MKKFLRKFWRKQDGSVSIEFVLWLPLICGIIVGAFSLNALLLTRSNMWNVARDTARRVSTGQYDATEATNYAQSQLTYLGYTYDVTVTDGSDVTVLITTTLSDIAVIGVIGNTVNYSLSASVTMRSES